MEPYVSKLDNVWWSPNFFGNRTQIGRLSIKYGYYVQKRSMFLTMFDSNVDFNQ